MHAFAVFAVTSLSWHVVRCVTGGCLLVSKIGMLILSIIGMLFSAQDHRPYLSVSNTNQAFDPNINTVARSLFEAN